MITRPAVWGAALGTALALFVVAVGLIAFGPGNAARVPTPTPPGIALGSPGTSGNPATPAPGATPTPEPTPPSTDKVQPKRSVGPKQLTGYGWPLKRAWITSRFAPRDFGNFIVIDGVPYHDGLDLATHCGDKVYATHDGTVLVADRTFDRYLGYKGHPEDIYDRTVRNGNPNALAIGVVIDDGNGYRSQYIHLKSVTVAPGQVVKRGDQIGVEGETGAARGCHVHYSLIRMDGAWQGILPSLWKYGYPERIREHVNPLDVLPWGDDWAPRRLFCQVQPCATPSPDPNSTPGPLPTGTAPTPTPSASPRP